MNKTRILTATIIALSAASGAMAAPDAGSMTTLSSPDPAGIMSTVSTQGRIDTSGAFFQSLGTNGRTCATCHVPSEAFGLSAAGARRRFNVSHGTDPLFTAVDGGNCPDARSGNRADHSLMLNNGLVRVFITLPANPEFTISVAHDPYGCALTTDPATGRQVVSVYRRPLPATNLGFLSAVMFDGRETLQPLASADTFLANLRADLRDQALNATLGHAQASQAPTDAQLSDIVGFELGLYTAQSTDRLAGDLTSFGAQGGPLVLSQQTYYPGINDSLGQDPTGSAFDASSMTLFDAWSKSASRDGESHDAEGPAGRVRDLARRAIAAGQELFNTAPLVITNVRGLNDNAALGKPTQITGHCSTCHDAPNVADHSLPLPLDIGVGHARLPGVESDADVASGLAKLSMPDLPVYLISGCPNPFEPGPAPSFYTSDPGKALISGKCADLDRVKGPILRGLAARAPYFHNGAAANLLEVVNFYDERFHMGLTQIQKAELVAFLDAL